MAENEYIAPISVDLRTEDLRMDIIKGIEHLNIQDEALNSVLQGQDLVETGDWLVLESDNTLNVPTTTAVANTFPVWVGNDQYDSQATGQATIILGGGFLYRTTKFVPGTYTNGQALTVKDLGGGERVPSAASGSDPVLCRVYKTPDSQNAMQIFVVNR
jgi:hypothetical protein